MGHAGGAVTIRTPRAVDSIDTALAYDTLSWSILNTVGDGLTGYVRAGGSQGTRLVPDLAVSLPTPTDGGRSYTFHLRRNVRYSTGRRLVPADVRWTIERDFKLPSTGIGFYKGIVGADACAKHRGHCDLSRGIVVDDHAATVTFHLIAPDPEFLYKLALPFADAVPTGTPAKPARTRPLPATGPYRISSYNPKRSLKLVRNRYFHQWSRAAQPAGYPNSIDLLIGGTDRAAITAVKRGQADAMSIVGGGSTLAELTTRFASQVHADPAPATLGYFFGTRVPPFNNLDARRAVNYAVDRHAAAEDAGGGSQPTCQILPPDFPGYRRYCPYTAHPNAKGEWTAPNLAEAKRLVTASGTKGMAVEVWSYAPTASSGRYIARLLNAIGYHAKVRILGNDYFAKSSDPRSRVQIGFVYWGADYPAASDFLNTQLSCASPNNIAGFCDRRIEPLIRRALNVQTYDPEASDRLWTQIDRKMVDQAPWLPLVTPKVIDFVSHRVGNYQYNPVWGMLIDQLWVR
jgi:peptide/nickel transport system substrate-binding protein